MNNKIIKFLKDFMYSFSANIVALLVSVITVAIVPKLLGVKEYGYWQVYVFYTSYVGFFNIGWVEGIYLRNGGKQYEDLDKRLLGTQFWLIVLFEIIIIITMSIFISITINDMNEQFILLMFCLCILAYVPRGFLLYLMQSTKLIKEYSRITLIDRIVYLLLVLILLVIGVRDFKLLIISDLAAKFITLIITIYICRDIVFGKLVGVIYGIKEALINISIGINLLIANIASMLIVGIVRKGIEMKWGIETFGKVSLTMSVSNLLMTFINAVGVILFPMLRRASDNKLKEVYIIMRNFIMIPLLALLILYYPIKIILIEWLPQYSESLKYMAILFPICIYESKMSMLINTYLKTLRKEKVILYVNIFTVVVSVITTYITISILNNLTYSILSITFLISLRCIISEIILSKYIKVKVIKDIFMELSLTIIFIYCGWVLDSWYGVIYYIIAFIVFIIIKISDLKYIFNILKSSLRSN